MGAPPILPVPQPIRIEENIPLSVITLDQHEVECSSILEDFFVWGNKEHGQQSPAARPISPTKPSPVPMAFPGADRRTRPNNTRRLPTDLANIKCFRCGEKGHYASFHDKGPEANPRIRAAHMTMGDDIRDDDEFIDDNDNDDAQSIQEQLSDNDRTEYRQNDSWQEVEFEEYPSYDLDNEYTEYMGMMTSYEEYDASSEQESSPEPEEITDTEAEGHDAFKLQYLTSKDFGETFGFPNFQHAVRVLPTRTARPKDHMAAMSEQGNERPSTQYKLKIASQPKARPLYSHDDKMCLSTYTNVNGLNAFTLWDTGSTSTVMSPNFADISKALVFNLIEPVTLQLGTVGS